MNFLKTVDALADKELLHVKGGLVLFTTSQNSISRALRAAFALCGVLGLAACSLDGSVEYLNGGPKGAGLQGKALMFQTSSQSQSLSNVTLSTCTDKKVTIHAVKTDGSIDTTSLGESKVSEDGSFSIPNSSQYPLGDSVTYVLMATGCGESFYRPVTDYADQDISMGTTFLGFLPEVDDSGKKQLNTLTLSQMSSLLSKLTSVNESNLSQSFDAITQDAASKSAFEALTGISMESLKEIPPTTVAISLPSAIKEGQSNSLSVTAQHWYSGYSKAYQWSVDGVNLSTTSSLSWSLGKNAQGAHTLVLRVGANGGSGNIDLGKPVYQKSMSLNVQDTYPATPPTVTMSSRVNTSALTVTVNTGAALINCETFSSFAITEGFLPPSASDFTRTCTTSGTQTESFTLSNTESTRQVSVWVKDAAGNISTTYSGQFVTLDMTPPELTLNNLTSTQAANTNTSVHWGASDLSGLASLILQYASDGTTFSNVVDLLVSNSASPYTWMVPADNVTTAKLKLVATDNAGNSNSVTTNAFSIDATVPGPPVATLSGAPTVTNGSFDITVSFTEAVTGLTASDFTVTNGVASGLVTVSGGSYTLTITPSIASGSTGITTVKLPLGTVLDYSNDPNSADSNTLSVNIDKASPTITLSSTDPNPTTSSITVTATVSESVTDFDSSDITVNNALVSSFGGSGTSYSFTLMPIVDGSFSAQVAAGSFHDAGSNSNTASNTLSRTYDTIRPTVTLSSATANPTNGAIAVTATFSESVTGFDSSDVTVTNASVGAVTGSGTTYTFTVTPTITSGNTGTVTIDVPVNKAQDSAGLLNTTSNTLTYSIDKVAPTVILSSTTSDPTNGVITVTATFSKSITGFDSSDVAVTNATVSSVVGSGTTYAFNVSPTIASGSTGTVTIDVGASSAQDSAGNNNTASNTLTYSIDKQVPTVSISSVSPDPTSSSVSVSVSFSENVTGFDSSDLTITNGTVSSVAGSGSSYTVVVAHSIGSQSTGTLSIQVAASGAADAAGNANTASNTLTRSIDTRGPSVTLASASASTVTGSFSVTATLSLSSTDFASGDVSVTGGSVSNFAGSGSSYTFDVVPSAQQASPGTISVSVAAGTLTDSTLGNANTVSNTLTRTATTLTQTWSTTLSSSDSSVLPVAGGVASLSSTNLTQTDFSTGTHVGTVGTTGNLTLSPTLPIAKELDSSWAPKWSNLVWYWKMNGSGQVSGNGGTPIDKGGTTCGKWSGPGLIGTYSTGKLSTGLLNDSYYGPIEQCDATNIANISDNISFGGWLKQVGGTPTSYGTLFLNYKDASSPQLRIQRNATNNTLYLRVDTSAASSQACTFSNTSVVLDGSWHHILFTLASGTVSYYVDGALSMSCSYSHGSGFASGASLVEFWGLTANGQTYLDEWGVWNQVLTANEVSYLYRKQNPNSTQSELDSSWTPHWGNLVGYWNMNGPTGAIADGSTVSASVGTSGTASNVNSTGMSYTTSQLNTAIGFDGTDDYITIADNAALQIAGNISISTWVYLTGTSASTMRILNHRSGNQGYDLGILPTGQVYWFTGNATNSDALSGTQVLSQNKWYHIVASYNSSNSQKSIYINGTVDRVWTTTYGPSAQSTATYLANFLPSTPRLLNGRLDELGVWNIALTGTDVVKIYEKQASKFGGVYISPVLAANSNSSWTFTKWFTTFPFFKELPGDTNADATPDSETSAEYSGISANLGVGLEGLWHFNESSAGTVTGLLDFADSSGHSRHLSKSTTGVTFGQSGILKNALTVDGTSGSATVANNFDTGDLSEITVSAWVKNVSNTVTSTQSLFYRTGPKFEILVDSTGAFRSWITNDVSWHSAGISSPYSDWNQWHHIVGTYDGANVKLYRDGILVKTSASQSGIIPGGAAGVRIGYESNNNYWNGSIDEAAMWSRALSAPEVLQLYRRGANRNKFQFRTCTQSDCSDKTDADWVGPDKTASSWFSELHNMTAVASTGDGSGSINLTAPLLDFSKWIAAVSGWAFNPTPSRYFQYRALMESDDVNNLCLDSSNNAIPCMPDITSVTPTAELSPAPYITSASGISFYTTLSSLSFTISGTCTSDSTYPAKFQLSKDGGSTYQYYNGTSWATAAGGTYSQASTIAQINAGLSAYICSSAPCTLTFRAYPGINAANSCNISAPVASVNRY